VSRRSVWSNLDFEYELAAGPAFQPNPQLRKLCRRWEAVLRLLPGCEEASIGLEAGAEVIPWGVSPSIARAALGQNFPEIATVQEINDKRYSHRLEGELGCAFPGSRIVGSLSELESAVSRCRGDWVLKHPLGVGGRERVTGKAGQANPQARSWAASRFAEGWTLIFEPWAYRRTESSFHFEIEGSGAVFLGQCGLVSDESGAFRGNRLIRESELDAVLLGTVQLAMAKVWESGYRGPVSVDSFRGFLGDKEVLRPIMEINARYSFGRMALELFRRVPEGWSLFWWHPKARELRAVEEKAREYPERWAPGVYRLPLFADPRQVTGSFLVVEPL
jgi:hypothetical protein